MKHLCKFFAITCTSNCDEKVSKQIKRHNTSDIVHVYLLNNYKYNVSHTMSR